MWPQAFYPKCVFERDVKPAIMDSTRSIATNMAEPQFIGTNTQAFAHVCYRMYIPCIRCTSAFTTERHSPVLLEIIILASPPRILVRCCYCQRSAVSGSCREQRAFSDQCQSDTMRLSGSPHLYTQCDMWPVHEHAHTFARPRHANPAADPIAPTVRHARLNRCQLLDSTTSSRAMYSPNL